MEDFLNQHAYVRGIYEDKVSIIDDELDMDIYEISKSEVEEMLESINPMVEGITEQGLPNEELSSLKRYLHTLKGSVRMAGANKVGMLAHRLESLLDYMGTHALNIYFIKDLLEKELEKIVYLFNSPNVELDTKKRKWLDEIYIPEVTSEVSTTVSDVNIDVGVGEQFKPSVVQIKSDNVQKRDVKQIIRVSSDVLDNIVSDAGEIRLSRTALEGGLQNSKKSLIDLKSSAEKIVQMLREVEIQAETQMQARKEIMGDSSENFDPLEFDRFTRLQELTRLMNEAVIDVVDTVDSLENLSKSQETTINQQAVLTNTLLDTLLKVRLVPVENLSERLYKITRTTTKELAKPTTLLIQGEKVEVDRLILEKITPSVEHLLRNCIAHGIESSVDRVGAGKPAMGRIEFDAHLEGNFVILEISDDGAGLNLDKIKEKGLKLGLLEKKDSYQEDEIVSLIFKAGFSTAESVTQVAGRGVGMDVVKSDVTALGGNVFVETEQGKGTKFKLVLPLTISNDHSMLVDVNEKVVAIPAMMIDQVYSFKDEVIQKAYQSGKLTVDNEEYSFIYAGHLLGTVNIDVTPEIKLDNQVIKIKYLNENLMLHVNKIEATQEILVKPLGPVLSRVPGLLGATLLGDGRQGLLINPILMQSHYEKHYKNNSIKVVSEDVTVESNKQTIVMVVDDSLTVRRASAKVLERHGFKVVFGKDGADALEQLQVIIPDIILSDIEMPKMDGFEFVRNIKNTNKYQHIPVIMITSRTADKHKQFAFELGANGFLGKPYKEDELINNINQLLLEKSLVIK